MFPTDLASWCPACVISLGRRSDKKREEEPRPGDEPSAPPLPPHRLGARRAPPHARRARRDPQLPTGDANGRGHGQRRRPAHAAHVERQLLGAAVGQRGPRAQVPALRRGAAPRRDLSAEALHGLRRPLPQDQGQHRPLCALLRPAPQALAHRELPQLLADLGAALLPRQALSDAPRPALRRLPVRLPAREDRAQGPAGPGRAPARAVAAAGPGVARRAANGAARGRPRARDGAHRAHPRREGGAAGADGAVIFSESSLHRPRFRLAGGGGREEEEEEERGSDVARETIL